MQPFRMARSQKHIRFATRVETVDPQYDIVDFGLQHENGDIDSLAIGGSFASAKRWVEQYDRGVELNAELTKKQDSLDEGEILLANGQVVTEGQPLDSSSDKVMVATT